MPRRNVCSVVLRLMAVVGVLAGALTILSCPGGHEEGETVAVAANDITVPVTTATVQSIESETFTFSSGEALTPALANQPIEVTFTNTASATPTATVVAPNVRGTDGQPASFSAKTTFGSCIFQVTSSTVPGIVVGTQITVDHCSVTVKTNGIVVNTDKDTETEILLDLGAISPPKKAKVKIDRNGNVTVNRVTFPSGTGTVQLVFVTGTVGSTP